MSTARTCPHCHSLLPADAPEGLCAACVLSTCSHVSDAPAPQSRPAPPPIEDVAAAFPEFDSIEYIASGGMGHVFKIRNPSINRIEALKLLSLDDLPAADSDYQRLFEREALAQAALNHSHIVTIHDSGTRADFCFIRMEYLEGGNLGQALKQRRITPQKALALLPGMCDALHHAHTHEPPVFHRDVKPANILLNADRRIAKLADFGLAKLFHPADPGHTRTGQQLGTPGFTAPEQQADPRCATALSDIYSMGCVIKAILRAADETETPLPPAIHEIARKASEDDPKHRYSTALELKHALEHADEQGSDGQLVGTGTKTSSLRVEMSPEKIVINGHAFYYAMTASELIQVLGPNYEHYSAQSWKNGYLWREVGISAWFGRLDGIENKACMSLDFVMNPLLEKRFGLFRGELTANGKTIRWDSDPLDAKSAFAVWGLRSVAFDSPNHYEARRHPFRTNDVLYYESGENGRLQVFATNGWNTPKTEIIGKRATEKPQGIIEIVCEIVAEFKGYRRPDTVEVTRINNQIWTEFDYVRTAPDGSWTFEPSSAELLERPCLRCITYSLRSEAEFEDGKKKMAALAEAKSRPQLPSQTRVVDAIPRTAAPITPMNQSAANMIHPPCPKCGMGNLVEGIDSWGERVLKCTNCGHRVSLDADGWRKLVKIWRMTGTGMKKGCGCLVMLFIIVIALNILGAILAGFSR